MKVTVDDGGALAARTRTAIGDESIRSFGIRAGVKPSTIQGILNGARPVVDNLVLIAKAADFSVEWLATGEGEMRRSKADPAPAGDIERRLEEVRRALDATDRLPVDVNRLDWRHELWPAYAELQALSRDAALPDGIRIQVDLYLRLAFDDRGAERRHEQRIKDAGARIREAYAAVDGAIAAIGWTPTALLKEELRAAAFRNSIQIDDLVLLLEAIREEVRASAAPKSVPSS